MFFFLNVVGWFCFFFGVFIGVYLFLVFLVKIFEGFGMDVKVELEVKDFLGVYCIDVYSEIMMEKLVKFMKCGGGLFIGG